ncbi:MAG: hypothetical protein AAFX41_03110 [Bacteroidota bacterium]
MIDFDTCTYPELRDHVNERLDAAGWTKKRAAEAIGRDSESGQVYVRSVLSGQPGKTSEPVLFQILDALNAEDEKPAFATLGND